MSSISLCFGNLRFFRKKYKKYLNSEDYIKRAKYLAWENKYWDLKRFNSLINYNPLEYKSIKPEEKKIFVDKSSAPVQLTNKKKSLIINTHNPLWIKKFSGNILMSLWPDSSIWPPGIGPWTAQEKKKYNVKRKTIKLQERLKDI